jgi:Type IV secretion-system coupling protein DNA-binding domain
MKELLLGYLLMLVPMNIGIYRGRGRAFRYLESLWCSLVFCVIVIFLWIIVGLILGIARIELPRLLGVILRVVSLMGFGYLCGGGMAYDDHHPLRSRQRHERGTIVSAARSLVLPWWWRRSRADQYRATELAKFITLAGIPVRPSDETKHFKFIGTTGTGKSTAICEMLSAALTRGDRAVIADPDGGYLSHFYNAERGDVILNPFDPDSVKWNLLGEITNDYDVDQLARSLIPNGGGSDRIWSGYARTFFTAAVQRVIEGGVTDDGEIYRLVAKGTLPELKLLLAGTTAGPFMEEGSEKMFGSLRSVTISAIESLKYTVRQRGTPFSVRGWVRQGAAVRNGGRGGVLFIPYKAGEIAALRSSISAWMRIAIFEAMNQGEGDQRLWFIVDELDALGEIDGLKDALARLRKFGGRCVLGFQSISQVSSTYGKGVADTIVENCGNSLVLRCSASEQGGTSQFASRLIGQRQVVHFSESKTWQPGQWFSSSTTTTEQRSIEPAIMASEIEQLPDLQGFLKFASTPDWQRALLTHVEYPTIERPKRAK